MVCCAIDSAIGTLDKVFHYLYVTKGVFLDGCRIGEHVDGESFPALFGLPCDQGSGRNVFYHIDVVPQYVIARYCPQRVVVRKQIFADLVPDLMNDLPRFVLDLYL